MKAIAQSMFINRTIRAYCYYYKKTNIFKHTKVLINQLFMNVISY